MPVSFNKFNCFVADLANHVHNLGSDTLEIALSNSAPVATNTVIGNISEIAYTNLSSRTFTATTSTQSSGLYSLVCAQVTMTASGSVGPFRYVVIYNSTASGKNLIGWYDYGSSITLLVGGAFTVGFDLTNGVLQLT